MREKALYLRLSKKEEEMIEKLMEELGFDRPTEYIRYLIRKEWEKLRQAKCVEEGKDEGR